MPGARPYAVYFVFSCYLKRALIHHEDLELGQPRRHVVPYAAVQGGLVVQQVALYEREADAQQPIHAPA